jgi:hypothetical protein
MPPLHDDLGHRREVLADDLGDLSRGHPLGDRAEPRMSENRTLTTSSSWPTSPRASFSATRCGM